MNNEENYISQVSPIITDTPAWKCQICGREGNQSTVIFTIDPHKEICNSCYKDCQSICDIEKGE